MSTAPETASAGLIRDLPKVELHAHLEGSIPLDVVEELAARHGVVLPEPRDRYPDFRTFVDLYLATSACLASADDLERAVSGAARELAAQNVRYAEMTFTPLTHVDRGVPADVLLEGLARGREAARHRHRVEIAWIFDIVRTLPHHAAPTLELALRERDRGVVGLGFAGPEREGEDLRPFVPVFERARAEGLASLPHAGELAGPANIWAALRDLGARRIGHGVRCLEDPALVQHLREHAIPLEVCPTSNVALGVAQSLAEHPLPRLLAAGVPLSLGSDDPALFRTNLSDELSRCADAFSWRREQVLALAAAAVEHSCLAGPEKVRLLAEQRAVADDRAG